jgi:uncharacterized protein (TIGR02599 family)
MNTRRSFTLLELLIAMVVFSLIGVGTTGVIRTVYQSWQFQRTNIDLIQNARWALQRMTQELHQAQIQSLLKVIGGNSTDNCDGYVESVCNSLYALDPDSNGFYYWRAGTVLYRGEGTTFSQAVANKQELSTYMYYNSANASDLKNGMFSRDSDTLYSIYVRVRDESVLKQGVPLEYQVQGQVRTRGN